MSDLTLYTNPMSRGRIARWMLEEVGEPYEVRILGYDPAGMKSADYLAINPMGKVPALKHRSEGGDRIVTEGAAICAYLADAFPAAGLAPADRAAYYRWLFFAAGPIEAAVTDKALGVVVDADKQRMAGYGNFETMLGALDTAIEGRDYVAGEAFSAADVYFGSQIGWGMMFGSIPKTPAREAYWQRLTERPAYQRAAALDDAAMPKKD